MFVQNPISSIWTSKEMSSEVKSKLNASNIECLRTGASKKQSCPMSSTWKKRICRLGWILWKAGRILYSHILIDRNLKKENLKRVFYKFWQNLRGYNICHITISIWHFSNWQKNVSWTEKSTHIRKKRVTKLETSLKKGQKVLRLSLCRIVPYVDVTGWHSSYITQNHRAVGR